MGELPDQQINDSNTTPVSTSGAEEEYTVKQEEFVAITPKQEYVDPSDSVSVSPGVADSGGDIDSPSIARSEAIPVNMIDSHEFRTQMGDLTYQTLNGRVSPSYSPTNNYATLTPLQPLPPISTVSDKFQQIQTTSMGNFQFINNGLTSMDMNYSYDKMMNTMSPAAIPMSMMSNMNGYANQTLGPYSYNVNVSVGVSSQNGIPSPKSMEIKPVLSPNHSYEPYQRSLTTTPSRIHSPMKIKQCDSPIPMMQGSTLNGLHLSPTGMESQSPQSLQSGSPQHDRSGLDGQNGKEIEEINTKELAQRISSELKRYSIPQAVFAQRVLCRSQGTLSDLLRNPKPWSKLKSGRETFRRMWKWLQEPEFQRMSALRLAGNQGHWSIFLIFLYSYLQILCVEICFSNAISISGLFSQEMARLCSGTVDTHCWPQCFPIIIFKYLAFNLSFVNSDYKAMLKVHFIISKHISVAHYCLYVVISI